jgi:hypothetical protein
VHRLVLALALGCAALGSARADGAKVALLPLDAPGKLAIYGQPVAGEVARVLGAAGLEVVVVGATMQAPRDAVLVIEGAISGTRRKVVVKLRLRALDSRTPLDIAEASAASLEALDRAASSVANQLLPKVQVQLEKLRPPATSPQPAEPAIVPPPAPPPIAALPPAVIAAQAETELEMRDVFVQALAEAGAGLAGKRWKPLQVELPQINPAVMIGAIATAPGAIGLAFDVRQVSLSTKPVLIGSVKVRVIVTFSSKVLFDRVLVTDTIVGGRKATREDMMALMAREVVSILRPRFFALTAAANPEPVRSAASMRPLPTAAVPSRSHAAR